MSHPLQTNLIREFFDQAVELPLDQRAPFLDAVCQRDLPTRRAVEDLLAAHDRAGAFLADPAVTADQLYARTHLRPGTRIESYTILKVLGEGGCGTVYLADQDRPLRRRVALKVIKAGMDTRQVLARFDLEREALARMDHPHIARVFDAGVTESGRPYFVMELVDGVPITRFCTDHRLNFQARLKLFSEVCLAVQHAHEKGILHRDLKPDNVLVSIRAAVPTPKVIDFGIAKALDDTEHAQTTITVGPHQFLGTPHYMSPEQACSFSEELDGRADVYALGALLYHLLTDTPPFDAKTLRSGDAAQIQNILRSVDPVVPSTRLISLAQANTTSSPDRAAEQRQRAREVEGEVDWIVMRAMQKDRARRYETAAALADDIASFMANQPIAAGPPGWAYTARKTLSRHRWIAALTAIVIIASTIIAIVVARSRTQNPQPLPVLAAPQSPSNPQSGLTAQLFAGMNFQTLVKTRIDPEILFFWPARTGPDVELPPPRYSIRWTGILTIPPGGATLGVDADDAARLFIDNHEILAFTKPSNELARSQTPAGDHTIRLDYWNKIAEGHVRLIWTLAPNPTLRQLVPATALSHPKPTTP